MTSGRDILIFGFAALTLFAIVYFFFDRARGPRPSKGILRPFNITFARLFGLITIAVLGSALALFSTNQQFATSAFTLLGTVAGYLAGAKATPTTTTTTIPPGDPGKSVTGQPPAGGEPAAQLVEEHL